MFSMRQEYACNQFITQRHEYEYEYFIASSTIQVHRNYNAIKLQTTNNH